MNDSYNEEEIVKAAEAVKEELIKAGISACRDALSDGLCCEGAWEYAANIMRQLSVKEIIAKTKFK